jgi:UDP-N-acetylmuramyl pentapeptide phosphotransferase/UDP-N-acetylglucosamine-1-phosphate transferase
MITAGFAALGVVVAALLWRALEPAMRSSPVVSRTNNRGHELPVASGVVVVLTAMLVGAGFSVVERWHGLSPDEVLRPATLVGAVTLAIGFGFIGLVDDLIGGAATKGFRGHLGALRRRQATTGLVKLVFGVVLGTLMVGHDSGDAVRSGVLIAATANLANLFDRAPGRVIKVSMVGAVIVALLGAPDWQLSGPMLIVGAGVGMLLPDLRERCMLGDTGANVLGAAVGWGLVLAVREPGEWIALAVVVALNLASEFVSFTRVIDAVAPLRWFDRWGTLPARRAHDATIRAASGEPTI